MEMQPVGATGPAAPYAVAETIMAAAHSLLCRGQEELVSSMPISDVLQRLRTSEGGLSEDEAAKRLAEYGPNELPERKRNPVLLFLSYMWNPLSWAMEIAAIVSIVLLDYADFGLIVALLLLNSTIAFMEERSAGDAVAALKAQLAPQCKVLRNGEFKNLPAVGLVPGDVIRIKSGDVVPADVKLLNGEAIKIDQSALTGESLPVTKEPGDEAYSGSICRQGEIEAVVHATGSSTFFGKAAALIASVKERSNLQRVLLHVGNACLITIVAWIIVELIVQFGHRGPNGPLVLPPVGTQGTPHNLFGPNICKAGPNNCPTLLNVLVLLVGGIPIAMPTVLSVTMAIGAAQLSKQHAIVTRLTAVEELAGMDVLCSDKTGTLTLNKLSMDVASIFAMGDFTTEDVMFDASLSARTDDDDPIDVCIVQSLPESLAGDLVNYRAIHYIPFDPVNKRTISTLQDAAGNIFRCAKGAPQVMLDMAHNTEEIRAAVEAQIAAYADRGYRSLGICRANGDVPLEEADWEFVGMVPLYDPPRADTAQVVQAALDMGIAIKMITGDQLAIARETARQLGMSTDIHTTSFLDQNSEVTAEGINVNELVEKSDGFAQVFPQHKFAIVKRLQRMGHVVGMTGDGVNDAPALKQSDIGIAVSGATDAARAAADIVLVTQGLGVIIDAIRGSREIFQRMKSYATYAVASTVRITFTFGLLTTIYNWNFPTLLIVIIAILNDGTIMTISKDYAKPSPQPDAWRLPHLFLLAIFYGLYLTGSTMVLVAIASTPSNVFTDNLGLLPLAIYTYEGAARLRGLVYLQVSISGQALIFITRTRKLSFIERPHPLLFAAFVLAQAAATIISVYGFLGYPAYSVNSPPGDFIWGHESFRGSGWGWAAVAWVWCIMWYIPLDLIKVYIHRRLKKDTNRILQHIHLQSQMEIAAGKRGSIQPQELPFL